ncbi:zf-TFIIB domain-containing protein [Burkholderia pseudomallei]|uniref:TFIIB-type zinc ribbon-containing protein n=1 Tax=Burkholderia pseudomallei TaxID=28450 RepID=UPI00015E1551|nr:zf-TFIIB domain-containing protein [Burkholderia pseudomallei]AIP67307.1 transcription factor zinc-finger family protein [Burkholderia pseudomallei]AJW87795.1 hypothetical protein BG92_5701 [Burkholderia pseudomallei 406e]AJX40392.1 transcription factor zinc-finger family protein [Burkholderia pseudomallei]AJX73664.1 transcription factor zinc-finger family protein [Burkholderia pseudomallei MSHR2543]AJX92864.1 transcription factor zinc-finger family protein [Burkholderia pseudomallei PB0829
MKCPVCVTPDLLMTERQSIEIDYCPTCRGVWLDRGELDKLIARADDDASERRRDPARDAGRDAPPARDEHGRRRHDARERDASYRSQQGGYRKKKSLFDMFDFD